MATLNMMAQPARIECFINISPCLHPSISSVFGANRYAPDGFWFGRSPVVIADAEGTTAAAIIPKIEAAIERYEEVAGHYRFWPGPNSNTFVASVLRAVPELRTSLPPTANGNDFKPGVFLGLTDSQTGIEVGLWGVLGVKFGWVEGLEINLPSFVAGLDLRHPALKLPGLGRVDFSAKSVPASQKDPTGTATLVEVG